MLEQASIIQMVHYISMWQIIVEINFADNHCTVGLGCLLSWLPTIIEIINEIETPWNTIGYLFSRLIYIKAQS